MAVVNITAGGKSGEMVSRQQSPHMEGESFSQISKRTFTQETAICVAYESHVHDTTYIIFCNVGRLVTEAK